MIWGTCFFKDVKAAERYYKGYHYKDVKKAVQRKIDSGEIDIGLPPLKENEKLILNKEEGRYFIDNGKP